MTDKTDLTVYDRMVRSLEGALVTLIRERTTLQAAAARLAEIAEEIATIDAELAIVTPKRDRVRP